MPSILHRTALQRTTLLLFCFVAIGALSIMWTRFSSPPSGSFSKNRDIYHIYKDASLLAAGENPYSRIESRNNKQNQKYTFYLPGFLLFASAMVIFGFTDYQQWMPYWLALSLTFHIGIGFLIYLLVTRHAGVVAGILSACFWIFSRWPLALLRSGQIDAVPIFFFILSLFFVKERPVRAAIALSISLSIKQMAALVAPLYLLWAYQQGGIKKAGATLLGLITLPLLLSLPFLIWDFESFVRMLLFPLTREPLGARSVDVFLRLPEKLQKLPFLLALLLTYWASSQRKLTAFAAIFFTIMVTLSFNPVFFSRYFCWAVPLIPLVCFQGTNSYTTSPKNVEPKT